MTILGDDVREDDVILFKFLLTFVDLNTSKFLITYFNWLSEALKVSKASYKCCCHARKLHKNPKKFSKRSPENFF